jgi:hypothetical protein
MSDGLTATIATAKSGEVSLLTGDDRADHEEWMKQIEEDSKRYAREGDEADKQTTT